MGVVLGGGGDHCSVRPLRLKVILSWWKGRGGECGGRRGERRKERLGVRLGRNRSGGVERGADRGGGGDRVGRRAAVTGRRAGDRRVEAGSGNGVGSQRGGGGYSRVAVLKKLQVIVKLKGKENRIIRKLGDRWNNGKIMRSQVRD